MAHWPKNSAAKNCVEVQGGLELAPEVGAETGVGGSLPYGVSAILGTLAAHF